MSVFRLCRPTSFKIQSWSKVLFPRLTCMPHPCMFIQDRCWRCTTNKRKFNNARSTLLHGSIDQHAQVHEARQKIRRRGSIILADIKETKHKMKEKMEEIIERENIWTIPNILCVTRICVSPYLGYLIVQMDYNKAFYLMLFAGVTDLLDGYIARNFVNQSSKLGSFLDPMADKILIATMFLSMTYVELMPVALTSLIIARDVTLAAAGFYIRYKSLPPPKTLSRYFDVTHATAQLAPTLISKVNTLVQLATVGVTLTAPVLDFVDHPYLHALWWATGASTVISAISYVYSKNTYKLLKEAKSKR